MPRVDRTLRNVILAIRRWDPDARIFLFGSRARGNHLKDSDYDLIVVSSRFEGIPFTKRIVMLTRKMNREQEETSNSFAIRLKSLKGRRKS